MNEWGIPDWRDATAYGDVKNWSVNRWRWEFYRRREDVRRYFDEYAAGWFNLKAKLQKKEDLLKPNEIGFTVGVGSDEPELVSFGYSFLPNPRFGNQPEWLIVPLAYGRSPDYILGARRYTARTKALKEAFDIIHEYQTPENVSGVIHSMPFASIEVSLERNEIGLVFDLNSPLGPQINEMKGRLYEQQRKKHGRILQARRHEVKWLGYLRTLDARADGATWAQIAEIHPATAGTEQTARDIWEAADALRFNF